MLVLYRWRFADPPANNYRALSPEECKPILQRAALELVRARSYSDTSSLFRNFYLEIVHPPGLLENKSLRILASDSETTRLKGMSPNVFRELARAMGKAGCYMESIFAEAPTAPAGAPAGDGLVDAMKHPDPVPVESDGPRPTGRRTTSIQIVGRHASIGPLLWENVPPLAVITGVNGAGKSQLLQVIASSCDTFDGPAITTARALFEGEDYHSGEVFYSSGKWETISSAPASEMQIREAIQEVQTVRKYEEHEWYIARKLNTSVDELRNMTPGQFQRVLTPGMLWTYAPEKFHSISLLFLAYRYFERDVRESGVSEDLAKERLGEPPWDLLSSVIKAAGLPFTFNIPPPLGPSRPVSRYSFEFQLMDRESNVVPLDQLSDGERVLLATSIWRYHADLAGRYHRLFLLDEPDAHLHPSLTRRFLNILATTFVEERGARVVLTTHSPSTVALAPEGSLFQMQREHPRIAPVSRADAIALLTDGFVAVQDSTRTVFLEGKTDPLFYQGIWQRLVEHPVSGQLGRLRPYPNLHFVFGQGKPTLVALVPQLRQHGFTNFLGIIDRDTANQPVDGVVVLGRYAIENYVYDPVNIYFYLLKLGRAPAVTFDGDLIGVPLRSPPALQAIIDTVVRHVEARYPPSSPAEAERVPVRYGGLVLNYPSWVLTRPKGRIKDQFHRTFSQFPFEDLIENYLEIGLIPDDIVALYRQLQGSDHIDV